MQRWSQSTLLTNWPWLLAEQERECYEAMQVERLTQTTLAIESTLGSRHNRLPSRSSLTFTGGLGADIRFAGRKENRQTDIHRDITGRIVVSERNTWLFWLLSAFFSLILSGD